MGMLICQYISFFGGFWTRFICKKPVGRLRCAVGGVLPFGAVFTELFFIMPVSSENMPGKICCSHGRMPWKNLGKTLGKTLGVKAMGGYYVKNMEVSGECHIFFFWCSIVTVTVTITVVESPVRRKVVFMAAPVLLPLRLFGPGLSAADGMTGMTLSASKNG